MKNYILVGLSSVLLCSVSSFAADSIGEKTDMIKRSLHQLISQLDEIKTTSIQREEQYSTSLATALQPCEQLEEEKKREKLPPISSSSSSAFSKSSITEVHLSLPGRTGYSSSQRIIHLNRVHYYNGPLKMEDFIESNENFFQDMRNIERENDRLKQENDTLKRQSYNNTVSYSTSSINDSYIVSDTPFKSAAGQIQEVKYKKGWTSLYAEKTVHLYSERTYYTHNSIKIDDIIESNENFFKRFNEMQENNNCLTQTIEQLHKQNSTLEHSISSLQTENRTLKSTVQQKDLQHTYLEDNFNKKEQSVQQLQNQLTTYQEENDQIKRENRQHLTLINNLETEKQTIHKRVQDVETANRKLSLELENQKNNNTELKKTINGGSLYVADLQTSSKQYEKEITEYKSKIADLNEELSRKEGLLSKSVPASRVDSILSQGVEKLKIVESERAKAITDLNVYKNQVMRLLNTANIPDDLLEKISDL